VLVADLPDAGDFALTAVMSGLPKFQSGMLAMFKYYSSPGALIVAVLTLLGISALPSEARTFHNPHIGGKLLNGCYSWPGPCKTRRQAMAFCRRKGDDPPVHCIPEKKKEPE
jgi:hypothetical protein